MKTNKTETKTQKKKADNRLLALLLIAGVSLYLIAKYIWVFIALVVITIVLAVYYYINNERFKKYVNTKVRAINLFKKDGK